MLRFLAHCLSIACLWRLFVPMVGAVDPNPPLPLQPAPFKAVPKYLVTKAPVSSATAMLCAISAKNGNVVKVVPGPVWGGDLLLQSLFIGGAAIVFLGIPQGGKPADVRRGDVVLVVYIDRGSVLQEPIEAVLGNAQGQTHHIILEIKDPPLRILSRNQVPVLWGMFKQRQLLDIKP